MRKTVKNQLPAMALRLRREFIRTAMISLLIILLVMVGALNIANMLSINRRADQMLQILADHDGYFPEMMNSPENMMQPEGTEFPGDSKERQDVSFPPQQGGQDQIPDRRDFLGFLGSDLNRSRNMEAPFETRYFWVLFDAAGEITQINTDRIASVEEDSAAEAGTSVYESGSTHGSYRSFRYLCRQYEDGRRLIVFVDRSSNLSDAINLLLISLVVMASALIMMYLLVRTLSGRAIGPVVESIEKQKRFISDAGHELKTPISIISANVDVLELTDVKNEWTGSIRSQVKRMTILVNNLLTLSRMEEDTYQPVLAETDLSSLIREAASAYDAVAAASGLQYTVNIEDDIHLAGDARALTQLCTLQLDNAMKYASKDSLVELKLFREPAAAKSKSGRQPSCAVLEITNACDTLPEGDLSRLFERFYRSDPSRNSGSGGHGIGLSVVSAIARAHSGTVTAQALDAHRICFRTVLPERTIP